MNKQEQILAKTAEILRDEAKYNALARFLQLIENDSLQTNLNYLGELQQKKDDIDNQHKEIGKILDDAKLSQECIDKIYYKIYNIENEEGEGNLSQVLIDIEDAQTKAQEMKESYQQFYDTKDSQGNETQGIITKLKTACKQIEDNKDNIADFKEFYNEIFEGRKEDGKVINPPLSEFIENKKEEMEELLETQANEFQKLYDEKNSVLTGLYDPTTAEGLAKAYQLEKIEIQKNIKWWNWIFAISVTLFLIAFGAYFYFSFCNSFDYVAFLRALPFWIFSGFFTFYSTKQIAEYKRMASEYAHKETLNKTYIGYKNQIEETKDNNLKQELLKIMLDSAKLNPSEIFSNKGEIPSLSLFKEAKKGVDENMPQN